MTGYLIEPNGCWRFTGNLGKDGYGKLFMDGKSVRAHRWFYEELTGQAIPKGMVLDHTCHTSDPECPGGLCSHRACDNPDHLEVVTLGENTARGNVRRRKGVRPPCIFDGCETPRRTRGYCNRHYLRLMKFGDPSVTIQVSWEGIECSIPGCDKRVKSRGWCRTHYSQWQRKGFTPWPDVYADAAAARARRRGR